MHARFAWFCLAILIAAPLRGEDAAKKIAPPTEAALADATERVKELYGDEWTAAKTAPQKQTLAKKLLQNGHECDSDRPAQFVLYRLARDIATQAADSPTALDAIDGLDKVFQLDALEMKLAVLTKSPATSVEQHRALCERAADACDDALARANFPIAKQLNDLALGEARKSKDAPLLAHAVERKAKIDELAKALDEAKAALEVL